MPASVTTVPAATSNQSPPDVKLKQVARAGDLAINGAQPMFSQPVHVGRPNVGDHAAFLRRASDILQRGWLSNNGPVAQEFERRIADFIGVKHCVAMCNGTIALEIAIRALDLKGEVIVPSFTFIATAHALQWQEITPIFADVDPVTHNLDPGAVVRMITPRTTGIVGVHLWSRPAPVTELAAIAEEYSLRLMYDASHGFGCTFGGRMLGNFGDCEVFSFHATKFFNTFEGGAVVTNDDELADRLRLMRNFGFVDYDKVIYPGTNGKMTEIAAAMGLTNLESTDEFVRINNDHHRHYRERIGSLRGLRILPYDERERNNFQYVVLEVGPEFRVARDRLIQVLHAERILARRYFWPGCHNMEPYRSYYPHAGLVLPNTQRVAERVVVLPTGSALSAVEIEGICSVIRAVATSGT